MQSLGERWGFTLGRSPAQDTNIHSQPGEKTEPPNRLMRMFLNCGKELGSLKKAHAGTGRTCKLHTDTCANLCTTMQLQDLLDAPAKIPCKHGAQKKKNYFCNSDWCRMVVKQISGLESNGF